VLLLLEGALRIYPTSYVAEGTPECKTGSLRYLSYEYESATLCELTKKISINNILPEKATQGLTVYLLLAAAEEVTEIAIDRRDSQDSLTLTALHFLKGRC